MKKITLLRVGGITAATSRFLDILEDERVNRFVVVDFEDNLNANLQDLIWAARFFHRENLLQKLVILPLRSSLLERGLKHIGSRVRLVSDIITYIDVYGIKKILSRFQPDLIWVGDNDFDYSNFLFYLFYGMASSKVKFVRSYKETRYVRRWDEKYMLEKSNKLVFPHPGYIPFFENLYQIRIEPKRVSFADLDWRNSLLAAYIQKIEVEKLSSVDGVPHVCILTGRALSEPAEKRSGFRYYYVPVIKELIKMGIKVHLHALKIVPTKKGRNAYKELAESNENFFLERPIKLTVDGYKVLKRYDAGLLHSSMHRTDSKALPLLEFQKINIPNRFYDYELAGVFPVVEKGALPYVEKLISAKGFGVVYENYEDLRQKLYELVRKKHKSESSAFFINSFADFREKLLENVI